MGPLHIGIWAWVGRNGVSASMPGMGAHGLEFAESANGLRSRAPVRPAWGWLGAGLGFAFTGWNRIGVSGVEIPVPCLVWMVAANIDLWAAI